MKKTYQKPFSTAIEIPYEGLLTFSKGELENLMDGHAPVGGDTDPDDGDPWV